MNAKDRRRFWSKVEQRGPDECWPWLGSFKSPDRYGQFSLTRRKGRSAHVVAWEIHNGRPLPAGTYGLHTCHNPNCVNPRHVYPGTQSENIRTSVGIGTHRNTRKTHCDQGHEFTEENTYRRPSRDTRECRICRREYNRANRSE